MSLSPGAVFLFNVAALEATMTDCKEIEPEHLFLAMCKISDVSPNKMDKMVEAPQELLTRIKEETARVNSLLEKARLDPMKVRRRLRRLLSKRSELQGDFTKHRSRRCRRVCEAAETRAMTLGEAEAQPEHFLWAVLSGGSRLLRQAVEDMDASWTKLCGACDADPEGGGQEEPGAEMDADDEDRTRTKLKHAGSPISSADDDSARQAGRGRGKDDDSVSSRRRARTPFLDKFGRDLTALAKEGKLSPCVGRKNEMRLVAQVLQRKTKNCPVLVGDAGVGKTCIVEGLARRAAHPDAPEAVRDWRVVEISMGSLIAGAMYQGLFEERLQTLIKEARSDPNLILFMDEFHTMVGAGGGYGRGMDAGQILKPALARGEVRLVGATTTTEYRKYIEPDAALERRLQMVWVNEPTREEAVEILQGLQTRLEEHHGVSIEPVALERAVEWSMRYLPDHRLPDKAIDIVDQACAAQILKTLSPTTPITDGSIGRAEGPVESIKEEDIARVISERCRVPIGTVAAAEGERLLEMEEGLSARVMGQDEAIGQVSDAIRTARAGLKKPNRPVGVFLFLGPTGVGKTELAKAMAEFLFGSEEALIRFDMSEYREKHNVSRLIGAPPGYVGHEDEGQLTGKVRTRPYCVILFDEIEKAHPDVFDIFLQIFDDGRLTDSKGRRAMFTESIIVMTSNLGTGGRAGGAKPIGISLEPAEDSGKDGARRAEHEKRYIDAMQKAFRPELLNRIDRKVVFGSLSREVVNLILDKLVRSLNERLEEQNITCEFSQEAKDLLLDEGCDETYGARELERVFDQRVSTPLARAILEKQIEAGQTVRIELRDGELSFA